MSRFSAAARPRSFEKKRDATTNKAGGLAFTTSPEEQLYMLVATSLMSDKYYETSSDEYKRMVELIKEVGGWFTIKLAAYTRNQMKLRSISVALLVEAAVRFKNIGARQCVQKVVRRADEFAEVIAYYKTFHGKGKISKFPNSLKRGLRDTLELRRPDGSYVFTEYHFAKYNCAKNTTSLIDVLNIVRPKPGTRERADLYWRVLNKNLEVPKTFEVAISSGGPTPTVQEMTRTKMLV